MLRTQRRHFRGEWREQIPRAVGKHPTTRITDILLGAARACSNCGIENVPSVCASDTTKKRASSAAPSGHPAGGRQVDWIYSATFALHALQRSHPMSQYPDVHFKAKDTKFRAACS